MRRVNRGIEQDRSEEQREGEQDVGRQPEEKKGNYLPEKPEV